MDEGLRSGALPVPGGHVQVAIAGAPVVVVRRATGDRCEFPGLAVPAERNEQESRIGRLAVWSGRRSLKRLGSKAHTPALEQCGDRRWPIRLQGRLALSVSSGGGAVARLLDCWLNTGVGGRIEIAMSQNEGAGGQILLMLDNSKPSQLELPPSTVPALLLTIREAAKALRLGRSTIYELIAAGEIEAVHIGRSARVPADEIERFVNRLRSKRSAGS